MHDHSPGKIHQGHACCVVCVSAVWSAVLSAFARAVWPGAIVLRYRVCAAVSGVEMGFWGVVLEAVRVVHVIIFKCVVQRGVAVSQREVSCSDFGDEMDDETPLDESIIE